VNLCLFLFSLDAGADETGYGELYKYSIFSRLELIDVFLPETTARIYRMFSKNLEKLEKNA